MKKFLFSTTALAVAGAFAFSGDANAAAKPIKIGVGGYMTSEMGFGSNSGSFDTASGGAEDDYSVDHSGDAEESKGDELPLYSFIDID